MRVECLMHLFLRRMIDEMILGRDVEHERVGDRVRFVQHLVDHNAIITDRRVDIGARGGHIGEAAAEAEADASDPVDSLAAQPVDRGLDILDPVVGVILAEIAERLLKFGLDIGAELHPGREAPEDVGCDREIAFGRPIVAFLADAFVDAEDFGDDDDRARAVGVGACDIGGDRAGAVERRDVGVRRGHVGSSPVSCFFAVKARS